MRYDKEGRSSAQKRGALQNLPHVLDPDIFPDKVVRQNPREGATDCHHEPGKKRKYFQGFDKKLGHFNLTYEEPPGTKSADPLRIEDALTSAVEDKSRVVPSDILGSFATPEERSLIEGVKNAEIKVPDSENANTGDGEDKAGKKKKKKSKSKKDKEDQPPAVDDLKVDEDDMISLTQADIADITSAPYLQFGSVWIPMSPGDDPVTKTKKP